MDRTETAKIMRVISMSFSEGLLPAIWKTDQATATSVWHEMLKDLDYAKAKIAVQAHIMTEKYPPTIADIRSKVVDCIRQGISAEGAWRLILDAVRHYGYPNSEEGLKNLPPVVETIARRFGWTYFCQMPIDEVSTYFAQFRNAYNHEEDKERYNMQISSEVRSSVGNFQQRSVKEIEESCKD